MVYNMTMFEKEVAIVNGEEIILDMMESSESGENSWSGDWSHDWSGDWAHNAWSNDSWSDSHGK